MKIWCLFSVENNYDQPEHNLVAWWREKPLPSVVYSVLKGSTQRQQIDPVLVVKCLRGEPIRFPDVQFTLKEVEEGPLYPC